VNLYTRIKAVLEGRGFSPPLRSAQFFGKVGTRHSRVPTSRNEGILDRHLDTYTHSPRGSQKPGFLRKPWARTRTSSNKLSSFGLMRPELLLLYRENLAKIPLVEGDAVKFFSVIMLKRSNKNYIDRNIRNFIKTY
jgi:hypothetical protein